MFSNSLLSQILTLSNSSCQKVKVLNHQPSTSKIASVAFIIRIVTQAYKAPSVEQFISDFRSNRIPPVSLHILLIKRAIRRGDPWSGDFAFPGGHLERNENSVEAAERETMEEIGLNLQNTSRFKWICELRSRKINSRKGRMVIKTHLYLDFQEVLDQPIMAHVASVFSQSLDLHDSVGIKANSIKTDEVCNPLSVSEFTLNQHEVDSVHWVSVEYLCNSMLASVKQASNSTDYLLFHRLLAVHRSNLLPTSSTCITKASLTSVAISIQARFLTGLRTSAMNKAGFLYFIAVTVMWMLGISKLLCPCIQLPCCNYANHNYPNNVTTTNCNNDIMNETTYNDHKCNSNINLSNGDHNCCCTDNQPNVPLWGLTYSIICDLLIWSVREDDSNDNINNNNNNNNNNSRHQSEYLINSTDKAQLKEYLKQNKLFLFDNILLSQIIVCMYILMEAFLLNNNNSRSNGYLNDKYVYVVIAAVICYLFVVALFCSFVIAVVLLLLA